ADLKLPGTVMLPDVKAASWPPIAIAGSAISRVPRVPRQFLGTKRRRQGELAADSRARSCAGSGGRRAARNIRSIDVAKNADAPTDGAGAGDGERHPSRPAAGVNTSESDCGRRCVIFVLNERR